MKWMRLRNRIRANPALLDPDRQLSIRQARAKWREVGRPSADELMGGARKKAGKSRQEWQKITGYKERDDRRTLRLRRLAVVSIIALLLALFMAFTAPGRAFALAIYKVFTTITNNELSISTQEKPEAQMPIPEYSKAEGQKEVSLSEIRNQLPHALLYLQGEQYGIKSINIVKSQFMGISVESQYQFEDAVVYITQRWLLENQFPDVKINLNSGEYFQIDTSSGYTIQGSYTESDHAYVGGIVTNNMSAIIGINNIDSMASAKEVLSAISLYNTA